MPQGPFIFPGTVHATIESNELHGVVSITDLSQNGTYVLY